MDENFRCFGKEIMKEDLRAFSVNCPQVNIMAGFRGTGSYPFESKAIRDEAFETSLRTK